MTNSQEKDRWSSPRIIEKQIDQAIGNHQTSASMINAIVGGVSSKGKFSVLLAYLISHYYRKNNYN